MADRDYSHRAPVEKLGIKPGHAVAFEPLAWPLDSTLVDLVLVRTGREPADDQEPVDVALVTVDAESNAERVLARWKPRLRANGGIWLLSPKRDCPGYVDQRLLIHAGLAAGLVDNKVCAVSDSVSAIRFVFRSHDRPR